MVEADLAEFDKRTYTYLLNTYLLTDESAVECRNSAIFQMTILMYMTVYGVSYYTCTQIKS